MNSNMVSRWTVVIAAGLMSMVGTSTAFAQARARSRPLHVRFVGTFQPFDEKTAGDLHTLTVSYDKAQWLFRVTRVNVIGGGTDPGTMLLNRIFPPRLSLGGPPALLDSLKNPENMGKQFTLEGLLYVTNKRFQVSSMKGEPEGGQQ
ncbi:MAG TPA: hypothetical protein VKK81_04785 [Candidatus Binatia bacterium]|nr:hypothetical protein [Candidatus Binatia bacterium]